MKLVYFYAWEGKRSLIAENKVWRTIKIQICERYDVKEGTGKEKMVASKQ